MLCLFDSSAFVKLVIDEDGSELAATLWDDASVVTASRLAYPECRAALAAAERAGRLRPAARRSATRTFEGLWAGVRVVELSPQVADLAAALTDEVVLGGADAVHLASAVLLGDSDVVLVTWDTRLRDATIALGLRGAPAA